MKYKDKTRKRPTPKSAKGLFRADSYIRIRPIATSGGHAQNGQGIVAKELKSWDSSSVSVGWCPSHTSVGNTRRSKEERRYTYPQAVIPPSATQEDTYETIVPPLLDTLLAPSGKCQDVLLFAYGQTGTGKTHTMLGPEYSLEVPPAASSVVDEVYPEWGLFPRAVFEIWEKLEATGYSSSFR